MSIEWKNRLSSKVYRDNLVGFVVEVDDIYRFFIREVWSGIFAPG